MGRETKFLAPVSHYGLSGGDNALRLADSAGDGRGYLRGSTSLVNASGYLSFGTIDRIVPADAVNPSIDYIEVRAVTVGSTSWSVARAVVAKSGAYNTSTRFEPNVDIDVISSSGSPDSSARIYRISNSGWTITDGYELCVNFAATLNSDAKYMYVYGATLAVSYDVDDGISKVEIANADGGYDTLIDLTNDTVTAETMLAGIIGHNALGVRIVGTHDPGGGLPSGIKAVDFGTVTVTSSAEKVVDHSLGETPDMVMVWADGNIAATNQMLLSVRSSQLGYRSSAYACFCVYHANSTTTTTTANTNSTTSGVCNFTSTGFSLRTYSSYYWSNGTQRTFNWIALKFN